jgi:hypothetical protein
VREGESRQGSRIPLGGHLALFSERRVRHGCMECEVNPQREMYRPLRERHSRCDAHTLEDMRTNACNYTNTQTAVRMDAHRGFRKYGFGELSGETTVLLPNGNTPFVREIQPGWLRLAAFGNGIMRGVRIEQRLYI